MSPGRVLEIAMSCMTCTLKVSGVERGTNFGVEASSGLEATIGVEAIVPQELCSSTRTEDFPDSRS